MVLVNGGFLHCTDIKNSCKFFSESDKKKIGCNNLKKSGEQSRAILALLFISGAKSKNNLRGYIAI